MAEKNHPTVADPKITARIGARAFRQAVKTAAAFYDGSNHIPVLNFVEVKIEKGSATVSYRDLDYDVVANPVDAEGQGHVLLPIRALTAFLEAVDGEHIDLSAANGRVVLRSSAMEVALATIAVSDGVGRQDFTLPAGTNGPPLVLAEGVFHWLLGLTLPCMSSEETRYYLNGVCFEIKDEVLRAVATDGHKLGHRQTSVPGLPDMGSKIVPRLIASRLAPIAKGREVEVGFTDNRARFVVPNVMTLTAKLIDGTFPDWRRVVPNHFDAFAEVEAPQLQRLFKAGRGLTRERGRAMRIEVRGGKGTAVIDDPDAGRLSVALAGDFDDADCNRGMNARYCEAIVKALGGRRVRFDLARSDVGSPMMIRNPSAQEGEFVVLMPMRV